MGILWIFDMTQNIPAIITSLQNQNIIINNADATEMEMKLERAEERGRPLRQQQRSHQLIISWILELNHHNSMTESKHLPLAPAGKVAAATDAASSTSTPLTQRLVFGALAGMGAATFCHPLDVIRVQMQTEGITYKNTIDAASKIYSRAGLVDGLYAGVSAAYLRQWMYGSFRIGIYAYLL